MKIIYQKSFIKSYKRRIEPHLNLDNQFREKFVLFLQDPTNPLLRDHKLIGKMSNFRAFKVSGDLRVVYKKIDDNFYLYDIGTHNQVY